MNKIECLGLVKRFGRKVVVDHVDLYVEQGEVVGLLGPNGAGKLPVFNMVLEVVIPTSGKIMFLAQISPKSQLVTERDLA